MLVDPHDAPAEAALGGAWQRQWKLGSGCVVRWVSVTPAGREKPRLDGGDHRCVDTLVRVDSLELMVAIIF